MDILKHTGNPVRLELRGRLDAHEVPQLKSTLHDVKNDFVLDFGGVNFIDSSGLSWLVSSFKLARERNLQMRILNVQDAVQVILEITGLHLVLPIERTHGQP